jgi:hypothetical protein
MKANTLTFTAHGKEKFRGSSGEYSNTRSGESSCSSQFTVVWTLDAHTVDFTVGHMT